MIEPHQMTVMALSGLIGAGKVTSESVVDHCVEQIERAAELNAFITVLEGSAVVEAKSRDLTLCRPGPLHGIPFAVKDVIHTAGIRTTCGSLALRDFKPIEDATVVARMQDAGAVLLGKLGTSEFAFGETYAPGISQSPRNPWDLRLSPGYSSSGSAVAVAAGLCPATIGTDSAGSIRGPAGYCGISGLKPTFGRVSRQGVFPLSYSLDTVGPLAWTVEDCAILLQAIAGFDERDPVSANVPVPDYSVALTTRLDGLRIAVLRNLFSPSSGVDADAAKAIVDAIKVFEDLGAIIVNTDLTEFELCHAVVRVLLLAEAYSVHKDQMERRPDRYSPVLRERLRLGAAITAEEYIRAQRLRQKIAGQILSGMKGIDAFITANQYGRPPAANSNEPYAFFDRPILAGPFTLTGQPALTVCCGFGDDGLPFAMQIAGKPFDETTILRIGHAYELATTWRDRRPAATR